MTQTNKKETTVPDMSSHYDMAGKVSSYPDAPRICLTKDEAAFYYPTDAEMCGQRDNAERIASMRKMLLG